MPGGSQLSRNTNDELHVKKRTGAGKRLEPLHIPRSKPPKNSKGKSTTPNGPLGKKKKKVFMPKDLEDVIRKISQTPLPTEVTGGVVKEAPEVSNATATEVANMREAVAVTAKGYNDAKLRADIKAKELATWKDRYVSVVDKK